MKSYSTLFILVWVSTLVLSTKCESYHCLCGITSFFNPLNVASRVYNFDTFARKVVKQGLHLTVVELYADHSLLNQNFVSSYIGIELSPDDIHDQVWQKERLLNIGLDAVKHLDCENVVWIDADIIFLSDNWINDICESLVNFTVVQPFEKLQRLSKQESQQLSISPILNSVQPRILKRKKYHDYNPGLVWAAKKDIISKVHLYDRAIVGGGDTLFCEALMRTYDNLLSNIKGVAAVAEATLFQQHYLQWAKPIHNLFGGNDKIGIITYDQELPDIAHLWHGDLTHRQYGSRHRILVHGKYSPAEDVEINEAGYLRWKNKENLVLKGRKKLMLRRIDSFFRLRQEDG